MNGLDIYINYLNAIIDNVDYYDTDKVSNKDNMDSISNLCRDIDDLSNMDKLYIIATGKPLFFSSLDFITDIVVTDYSLMLENMVESEEIREEITRYCGNLLYQDSENYMSFDLNSVINFDDSMSTISDEIYNGVEELSDTARVVFEQQDAEDLEEEDEDEYTEEIPKYDREEEEDEDLEEGDDEEFLYYDESEELSQSEYIDADELDDDENEFEDDYDSELYEYEKDTNSVNIVDTLNSELSSGKPRYEIEDDEEDSDDIEFEDDEDDYYLYEDSDYSKETLNKWDMEDDEDDEDIYDDDSYYLEDNEYSETNNHLNKWDIEDESEDDEFDEDYTYSDKNNDINSDNSYNSYDSNLYYEDMLAEGVFSDNLHRDAWDKELEEDKYDEEFDYSEDDELESEVETLNKWDRDDEEDEFDYDDEFDSDDSDYIAPSKHNNNLGKNGNSDASKKFEEAKIEKSFANQIDFGDNSKNTPDEELLLISGSNNNSEFGNTITTKSSSKSTEEIVAESIVKLSEGVLNIPNSLKNRLKVMKNLVEKDELE